MSRLLPVLFSLILLVGMPASWAQDDSAAPEQATEGQSAAKAEAEGAKADSGSELLQDSDKDKKEKASTSGAATDISSRLLPILPMQKDTEKEAKKEPPEPQSDSEIQKEVNKLKADLKKREALVAEAQSNLDYANGRLESYRGEYKDLEQRFALEGFQPSVTYSNLLRRRLDRLQNTHLADDLEAQLRDTLEEALVQQFRLEEFGAELVPNESNDDQLQKQRQTLLTQVREETTKHISVLNKYLDTVRKIRNLIDSYQDLVRQHLFWLPSTGPITLDIFGEFYRDLKWLARPEHWERIVVSMPDALRLNWAEAVLFSGLALVLLKTRKWFLKRLRETADSVGDVSRDHIGVTIAAMGYTLILALPGVVLVLLVALLVSAGGRFGAALAVGLTGSATLLFLLQIVRHICQKDGLGERHFNWSPNNLAALKRAVPRLVWVMLPATTITIMTEAPVGEYYRDSLGRTMFVMASVALALFSHRVLRADRSSRKTSGLRKAYSGDFIHVLAVVIPLVLLAASLMGYHYTAVELEASVFTAFCWIGLVTLIHYLSLRLLAIRERRLYLQRLRDKRAELQRRAKEKEAVENSGEGVPLSIEMPKMDLHDISKQSTALMSILAYLTGLVGLWWLLSDVIPAFQALDSIELWKVSSALEESGFAPITLMNVGLAVLYLTLMVLAAKNLPGTLEVLVLSRMNLSPGSAYAVTTMATYLIIIVGVVSALSTLGTPWSKLQWLVAALGVGLGFGLQEVVANFVSGIILLFERPIRVGDTVTIGNTTGTVSRIRIRATTLVDWDRKEQIIPNKTFVTQDLTNWTLSDSITRVIIAVGVAYGTDVDRTQQILLDVAKANSRVVTDPAPTVFCVNLGNSSIDFEMRLFVKSLLDIMPIHHEMRASVTQAFAAENIEIPFPQQDIHIRTPGVSSEVPELMSTAADQQPANA